MGVAWDGSCEGNVCDGTWRLGAISSDGSASFLDLYADGPTSGACPWTDSVAWTDTYSTSFVGTLHVVDEISVDGFSTAWMNEKTGIVYEGTVNTTLLGVVHD